MVNLSKSLSLEQLISRGRLVLFDTSALISYLDRLKIKNPTKYQKIIFNQENYQFYALLRKYLSEGKGIYVTFKVFEEFSSEKIKSPYKKEIKKIEYRNRKVEYRTDFNKVESKLNLHLARTRRDAYKEEKRFIRDIEVQERILVLNLEEKADYEELNKRLSDYRSYSVNNNDLISDADWDFLLSGIVISKSRNLVSLVSNDSLLMELWKLFIRRNIFSLNDVDFFVREGYDNFKTVRLDRATYEAAVHNL